MILPSQLLDMIRFDQLKTHSEQVVPGDLFVALPGVVSHGDRYVARAIERGARVILSKLPRPEALSPDIAWVQSDQVLKDFASLAHRLAGDPVSKMQLVAVTGTNGKSTIAHGLYTLLNRAGYAFGLFGTVENRLGDHVWPALHTTPDLLTFLSVLREMKAEGATGAVLEVSSHALDQERLIGVQFDRAIFTNLTQDHLDYHKTMEAYYEAKARLFSAHWLKPDAIAIVNGDDAYGARLVSMWPDTRIYGLENSAADICADDIDLSISGAKFSMTLSASCRDALNASHEKRHIQCVSTKTGNVTTSLIGRHNIYNLLAMAGTLDSFGIPLSDIAEALSSYEGLRGRLERVTSREDEFHIFVDYAHTPDALHQVLRALRALIVPPGKLNVVFGCGGDRDRGKRPLMGKEAAVFADRIYLTSDNPRREDPKAIIDEILSGIPSEARVRTAILPDRRVAIKQAVADLCAGDILLVAGKGHETTQIMADCTFPFDDVLVVRESLR